MVCVEASAWYMWAICVSVTYVDGVCQHIGDLYVSGVHERLAPLWPGFLCIAGSFRYRDRDNVGTGIPWGLPSLLLFLFPSIHSVNTCQVPALCPEQMLGIHGEQVACPCPVEP